MRHTVYASDRTWNVFTKFMHFSETAWGKFHLHVYKVKTVGISINDGVSEWDFDVKTRLLHEEWVWVIWKWWQDFGVEKDCCQTRFKIFACATLKEQLSPIHGESGFCCHTDLENAQVMAGFETCVAFVNVWNFTVVLNLKFKFSMENCWGSNWF